MLLCVLRVRFYIIYYKLRLLTLHVDGCPVTIQTQHTGSEVQATSTEIVPVSMTIIVCLREWHQAVQITAAGCNSSVSQGRHMSVAIHQMTGLFASTAATAVCSGRSFDSLSSAGRITAV